MKKKSYICPFCKEKQTSIIQWQTVSVAYEFDLNKDKSEKVDEEGGDHESWNCPSCGKELPSKTSEKVAPF